MNENIDLTKILKNCPIGPTLYSIDNSYVEFLRVDTKIGIYHIVVKIKYTGALDYYTKNGKANNFKDAECCLFPSKDQRDWSKFIAPWYNGKNEQKSADKIEPRFKVGDWVVKDDIIAQIIDIQEQYYVGLDINGKDFVSSKFLNSDKIHLWTINNVKTGNVLALSWLEGKNLWEKIVIFKKYHSEGVKGLYNYNMPCVKGYGITLNNGKIVFNEKVPYYSKTWTCNLHPTTKEQRDRLFQKIKEVGYKWNTETNTFEKLVEPKFNPKTMKPFDKVIVKTINGEWTCAIFSHITNYGEDYQYDCCYMICKYCIPYNDDTKYLVGTTKEAPEYYRYWEIK